MTPVQPRPDYIYRHARACKGCGALIHWWETVGGAWSPHDADGTSHFASCPRQADFRKQKDLTPLERAVLGIAEPTE